MADATKTTTPTTQQTPGEPEVLKPLRDKLRAAYGRKQWANKAGTTSSRVECWTTRKGNTYLIQIWDDGQYQIFADATAKGLAAIE